MQLFTVCIHQTESLYANHHDRLAARSRDGSGVALMLSVARANLDSALNT